MFSSTTARTTASPLTTPVTFIPPGTRQFARAISDACIFGAPAVVADLADLADSALVAVAALARLPEPVVQPLARGQRGAGRVVQVQRLREPEPAVLPVPSSPSLLFAMARNFGSRATRARCARAPRSGW